jgi:methylglutaconyl-CoA hydratase
MNAPAHTLCEQKGPVLWITINRPEKSNAISEEAMQGIAAALDQASNNRDILAVVLTGAGERSFCAGADLKPDSSFLKFDYSETHSPLANLFRQANRFELPLIARVNGHVMAGGVGLLSMCDMAIAADDVRIGLPEVKIGAFPMQVASVMQHLVTRRKFVELCLTGEPASAAEALDFGLLNYVVPRAQLDAKVDWLLSRLIDKSPAAIRRGKNALRAIADMPFEQSITFTEQQLTTVVLMEDAIEGRASFNEKRKPKFTGK